MLMLISCENIKEIRLLTRHIQWQESRNEQFKKVHSEIAETAAGDCRESDNDSTESSDAKVINCSVEEKAIVVTHHCQSCRPRSAILPWLQFALQLHRILDMKL